MSNRTLFRTFALTALLCFELSIASASETQFMAKVEGVRPNGNLICRVVRFLKVDPYERNDVKRTKRPFRVEVEFNEVALPESGKFRAQALDLIQKRCVGQEVTVSLGLPNWRKGKVIADVELNPTPKSRRLKRQDSFDPDIQLILIKHGLATSKDDGKNVPDDVLDSAEATARAKHLGQWSITPPPKHLRP